MVIFFGEITTLYQVFLTVSKESLPADPNRKMSGIFFDSFVYRDLAVNFTKHLYDSFSMVLKKILSHLFV